MSDVLENVEVNEETDFVTRAFGDNQDSELDSHSQEVVKQDSEESLTETNSDVPPTETEVEVDSGKEEEEEKTEQTQVNEQELVRLQSENTKLYKRLHDTQKAFHNAKGESVKIRKELEELKKANEDTDWLEDEDEEKINTLEKQLETAEQSAQQMQSEYQAMEKEQNDNALKIWNAEVNKIINDCPDFEATVYGYLGDKLKEDEVVNREFQKLRDKTPKNVYQWANRLKKLEGIGVPEVKSQKKQEQKNENIDSTPRGKKALDNINSALPEVNNKNVVEGKTFVENIFGT